MSSLLTPEDYSMIESRMDGKKLYFVEVEAKVEMYVLASSVDEARREGIANRRDVLHGEQWDADARELNSKSHICGNWEKECPFGDEEITCEQFLDFMKEKERKKKITEEIDKKQLKFDFE